tara:strand:- start:696 stop:1340 length:645 start_codon:yes stop_codon:yes gene_type:complete
MIYAVGDIHGMFRKLVTLIERIQDDASPSDDNTIVFLGDYIDRGPDSRRVLELIASEPLEGFKHVFLKGNHEDMMINAMDGDSRALNGWISNGGADTMKCFEGAPDLLLEQWTSWMRGLPYHYEQDGYLFVHAGIDPGVPLLLQNPSDLLWIREKFTESDADHGFKKVVHGHTPVDRPEILSNRINIDTGACYAGGTLTAIKISQTGDTDWLQV